MGKKYVAVDLGAESGRVMVGEIAGGPGGGRIGLREAHRFANVQIRVVHEKGERLHWDILRLWHEIKVGLGKAVEMAGEGEIESIGVDVWGIDFALVDERGELVGNPVCYRDGRTEGMEEKVFGKISRERVYGITGIQTMAINTLFQLASLSFGDSPQLKAVRAGGLGKILFLPDLLTYWLCGKMGTEYTMASTSQMLDARGRGWSEEILRAIGLEAGMFAAMDMPGERGSVRGTVLPGVNEKMANKGVKVIAVGSHDTASAVAAVPAEAGKEDWLYLSSGTWSLLGAEVDEPVLTAKAAEYNVTNEGGIGGKIRLLKNIAGLWLLQECKREWARQGKDYEYGSLTRMAEGAEAHLAALDLNDGAFAVPGDMPGKIAEQCRRRGQRVPTTPGEFTRVILESLAATYAVVRGMLEEITGKKFRVLHIVGGGSQNDLLNQLAADATGMRVLAGPVEATALGNVLAQAIALGDVESVEAGRAMVRGSVGVRVFEPRM